jgi:hypothetical protein
MITPEGSTTTTASDELAAKARKWRSLERSRSPARSPARCRVMARAKARTISTSAATNAGIGLPSSPPRCAHSSMAMGASRGMNGSATRQAPTRSEPATGVPVGASTVCHVALAMRIAPAIHPRSSHTMMDSATGKRYVKSDPSQHSVPSTNR